MIGNPPPDDSSFENRLRLVGQEADFTNEACFQQLMQQLVPQPTWGPDQAATMPIGGAEQAHWESMLGRRFGDYELLAWIARGGMGVVFKARQLTLNRIVAIKMIRSGELASDEELQRFQREAVVAAKLDHPAIVPVYETGCFQGQPFYSMGFIDGISLAVKLHAGPLKSKQAARLLEIITSGMQYAHDHGVVHRDLKPSNIVLSRDVTLDHDSGVLLSNPIPYPVESFYPKVADFGLASLIQNTSELTTTGQLIGTPSYMAPEQAQGQVSDAKLADVYSMGAILYAMLTGRPPFQSETTLETLRQVVDGEVVIPSRLNPAVHRDLETICLKCLDKTPARRYQSPSELGLDLRRFLDGHPVLARPLSPLQLAWRWCLRNPTLAALMLASSLSVLVSFILVIVSSRLSLARAQTVGLEREVTLRNSQLSAAQQIATAQQHLVASQQYHAIIGRVRALASDHPVRWSEQALRELVAAAALETHVADVHEIQNLAATCLTGTDLQPIAEVKMDNGDTAYLPVFHPNGTAVAVAVLKNEFHVKVLIASVPKGEILHRLTAPTLSLRGVDGIRKIAWLDEGNTLAVSTRSGNLVRWDLTQSPPAIICNPIPYGHIDSDRFVFDVLHRQAYLVIDKRLHRWSDFSSLTTEPLNLYPVDRLTISRDGRWLAADDLVYETRQDDVTQQFVGLGRNVDFSDDGRMVLGESLFDMDTGWRIHRLVDPATGRIHEDAVTDVQISPSGHFLITGGHDQKFKLWDAATCHPLQIVSMAGASEVRAVFSPDERYVAAAGADRLVLHEIKGLPLATHVALHTNSIEDFVVAQSAGIIACVARSRADNRLAVTLWELASGRMLDRWTIPGYQQVPCRIAITADARHLAVGNHDRILGWRFESWLPPSDRRSEQSLTDQSLYPMRAMFHGDRWTRLVGKIQCSSKPIAELGLNWDHVDAAIHWGNGVAYLFSGDEYCAINQENLLGTATTTRKISTDWPGLWESDLDAAIMQHNGYAYFFKGTQYTRVNAATRLIDPGYPKSTSRTWKHLFPDSIDAAFGYNEVDQSVWFLRDGESMQLTGRDQVLGPIPVSQTPFLHDDISSIDAAIDLGFRRAPDFRWSCDETETRVSTPSQLVVNRDGNVLLSVEDDSTLMWRGLPNLTSRNQWQHQAIDMSMGVGTITSIAARDQFLLAGSKNGSIHRLPTQPASGEIPRVSDIAWTGERIMSLWMNEAETFAVWGSQEGAIGMLSLPEMEVSRTTKIHRGEVSTIVGTQDGSLIASGSHDQSVILWNVTASGLEHRLTLNFPGSIGKLALVHEDTELLVWVMGEASLRRIRLHQIDANLRALLSHD